MPASMATRPEIVFNEEKHTYLVNGERLPSVTQVIKVIDKPSLPPWAAKVTIEGLCNLVKLAKHTRFVLPDDPYKMKAALKRRKLDHQSALADSQVRGKSVHKVLEDWINHCRIPVLNDYPVSHRGYIQGLTRFLVEKAPTFLESEKMVASVIHGFVGTRDTVCFLDDPKHGRCMLDLKTSKGIYPSTQFPQLAAYELAGVECGESPTDAQGIVRVAKDGTYEIKWSCATADDFLAILACYKSQQALIARAEG